MVDDDAAPLLGLDGEAPLLGLELAPPAALEPLLELGELELAPPEAEPDFVLSLEGDPVAPEAELDEELGELGLADEAPPDGDEDAAPLDGVDGDEGELDGEEDVLELEEPGPAEVLLLSPRSHAATPKASATAAARMESFMCPPWVGIQERKAANCAPGLTP